MIENLSGKNLIFNRCEEESNLGKGIRPQAICSLLTASPLKKALLKPKNRIIIN
jgi:hypothetical protein